MPLCIVDFQDAAPVLNVELTDFVIADQNKVDTAKQTGLIMQGSDRLDDIGRKGKSPSRR